MWRGQALLSAAIGQLHAPDQLPAARAFLTTQLQAMGSTLRSVKEILRSHDTQVRAEWGGVGGGSFPRSTAPSPGSCGEVWHRAVHLARAQRHS